MSALVPSALLAGKAFASPSRPLQLRSNFDRHVVLASQTLWDIIVRRPAQLRTRTLSMFDSVTSQEGPQSTKNNSLPTTFLSPEIVELILSHCDDRTLAVCARLSHSWQDASYRILYDTITDLKPLLSLLGSLHYDMDEKVLQFGSLHPYAWPHFQSLSRHVQTYDPEVTLSPEGLADLHLICDISCPAVNSDRVTLFPNLRYLRLALEDGQSVHALKAFLNSNLQTISLEIPNPHDYHDYLPIAARLVHHYAPNAHSIEIRMSPFQGHKAAASLSSALSGLTQIRRLALSSGWLYHPRVWAVLGYLPNLRSLDRWTYDLNEVNQIGRPSLNEEDNIHDYPSIPVFKPESFPSLQTIDVALPIGSVAGVLRTLPSSLNELNLLLVENHAPPTYDLDDPLSDFLQSALDHEPHLISLSLTFLENTRSTPTLNRTVLHLEKLIILVDYPLLLDDQGLIGLTNALPNLTFLELGPDPIRSESSLDDSGSLITLNGVEGIARTGSRIKHLALYVNVNQKEQSSQRPDTMPLIPYSRFTHLQMFNVGSSRIRLDDIPIVAQWLSGICPSSATSIKAQRASERPDDYGEKDPELLPYLDVEADLLPRWEQVETLVKQMRHHAFLASAPEREEIVRLRRQLEVRRGR